MKQLFKPLLAALLLLCSIVVNAHDFEVDGIYYNILSEKYKTVEVTYKGYNYNNYSDEYTGAVIIPVNVKYNEADYSVTSIGGYAFSDCSSLTSITIPNSVTSIGGGAFSDCSSLTSIEIPNSVTSIGDKAFNNCYGLTSITIPNSVTSIGGGAFNYCIRLTSIEIPNSVTSIGGGAFNYCIRLTSIEIPNSVTSIGGGAFSDCSSLTSIEIPNSVTSIGDKAFNNCYGLTSITIPNSVTSIERSAFSGCSGLTSITIPNSVTSIGNDAFYRCSSLTSITIPNSVTSIGNSAFESCRSLTSIEIPNSVTSIGDHAFAYCSGLTSITIPNSVTSIGSSAFSGCSSLTSITIPNSVTSIESSAFEECSSLTSITIPSSVTSIGGYAFFGCSGLTCIEIPNSVTSIGDYAFYGCSGLTCIEIPNSVTSIGSGAFSRCSSLTSIRIPHSVTSIGSSAFSGCNSLTSIEIPNSVTNIGSSAFSGCSRLTSIEIPNSVTSIGNSAFYECSGLTSITIPSSVTSIGNNAFRNCSSLTSIEISNSVTSIGDHAFAYCSGLTSITIPNSVTSIERSAFYGCSSLTSITIPSSVTSIENSAFESCRSLTSIEIPNSVTSIGDHAFAYCSGLERISIDVNNSHYDSRENCNAIIEIATNTLIAGCKNTVIPNTITSIGECAFSYCRGLTSIEIPSSVTSIGSWAFMHCSGLTSITIPNSVTSIGYSAFSYCWGLTSIEIPSSVTSIGEWAFGDCKALSKIVSNIPAENLFIPGDNAFLNIDKETCILYVPKGSKAAYISTEDWEDFKNIVEIKTTYKVTFFVDDKEFTIDSVAEGDKIIYPEIPEKEGYTFMWDTNIDIMPSNDITITGKYFANSYLLTYKIDGNVYASDSIAYGATITPVAEPTKEGYTFSGWSEIPETMPANDVIIEGSFSINTYNITYKVDGEIYATDSIKYGSTIEPIAEPTKEGHTFSGWSEIPETMPANDVVVEGSFSINSYIITYKVDGEIYATDSIKYGSTIEPIAEPTKEGYTFSGWSEIPETMPAKDIIVEGSFSINSYTVTFMVDGEVYETMTVEYGATIEPIAEPTKEGHTFSGWSDIPRTMPAKTVIVNGSFTPNSYTVTFKVDGAEYKVLSVVYGTAIPTIAAPTKEGHTFSGWSEIPETMPAKDIVVEGSFSINSYTVTFMVDGEIYETMTVEYGAEIELPTPPEKEGYIFTGWIDVPATMPAEDIVIEGRFEVDTTGINAVTLDLEKNEVYNLKGQRITESENLTRGIYIVNGRKVLIK